MNVPLIRNVTTLRDLVTLAKNVNQSVLQENVILVQIVLVGITEPPADADLLYKEMELFPV